jgi:hypothetical protein
VLPSCCLRLLGVCGSSLRPRPSTRIWVTANAMEGGVELSESARPCMVGEQASLRNGATPAASPTILAAVSAQQPGMARRVGATSATDWEIRCSSSSMRRVAPWMSAKTSRAISASIPVSGSSHPASSVRVIARRGDLGAGSTVGRSGGRASGTVDHPGALSVQIFTPFNQQLQLS